MESKICNFCGEIYQRKEYETPSKWRKRKYCSNHCSGMSHRERIIEANKARRKYPEVEGLTRQQVFYRFNPTLPVFSKDKRKRESVINYLGARCVDCGYDKNILGLVLDHKNGDGDKDRKRLGSKISRYYSSHLSEAKENLQILCATCNQIKSIVNKEHNKTRRITKTLKRLRK